MKSQERLHRGHADPKRTQMTAQATIQSKTLNQHRQKKQNILILNEIQTISINQCSLTEYSSRNTPTKGGYLYHRKNKISHNKAKRRAPHAHKAIYKSKHNRNQQSSVLTISQYQWTQYPYKKTYAKRLGIQTRSRILLVT